MAAIFALITYEGNSQGHVIIDYRKLVDARHYAGVCNLTLWPSEG